MALRPALEIGLGGFLRLFSGRAVDAIDIKIAVFSRAVLAAFVQRRAHQHIVSGLCQPRTIAVDKQGKRPIRAVVIPGIKTGCSRQIDFIGQGRRLRREGRQGSRDLLIGCAGV